LNETIKANFNNVNSNPGVQLEFIVPDSDFNAIERVTSTTCDIAMIDPFWALSNGGNMIPFSYDNDILERVKEDGEIYSGLMEDITVYDENKNKEIYGLVGFFFFFFFFKFYNFMIFIFL